LLPLVRGGEFARGLERSRKAALEFYRKLSSDSKFVTAFEPELDIVIFVPQEKSVSAASAKSRKIFETAASHGLHLALAELPVKFWRANWGRVVRDGETVTCLRSVLMKPEHLDWVERIWDLLNESAA
jgi:hypothetical protein